MCLNLKIDIIVRVEFCYHRIGVSGGCRLHLTLGVFDDVCVCDVIQQINSYINQKILRLGYLVFV